MSSDSKTCCGCNENNAAPSLQTKRDIQAEASHVSVFIVPRMDSPTEENLNRTAIASLDEAVTFEFDIPNRKASVYHLNMAENMQKIMASVGLGAKIISLESVDREPAQKA